MGNDPRFSQLLMEIVDVVLEMYGSQIGKCPTTDKLLLEIRNRVDREVRNMRQLATLQGSIDLILAAASASDKPELRSEEVAFKEHCRRNKEIATSNPSDTVLSWEKTLIHNIT